MSYDFAVLTPEAAGTADREAAAAAAALFDQDEFDLEPDQRLQAFVADLEAAGAADEETGWLSVWPIGIGQGGVALPTTYTDVDSNLVTLLRLTAGLGLTLVDLSSEVVHPPAPGLAVGVMAGNGTRLGALTDLRLESLLAELPSSDPWLVLERDRDVYVQTYRQDDGTFQFEHRDGSAERHYKTAISSHEVVATRMWAWLRDDPN